MSPVIIFWLNTLKDTAKAPAVDLLRLNTLRGTKTAFLIPFILGVPPPPPQATTTLILENHDLFMSPTGYHNIDETSCA